MRWQTEIIIFIISLNLATGLMSELVTPYLGNVPQPSPTENASSYVSHYNVSDVANWKPDYSGTDILGDIGYAFNTFFRLVSYIFAGFPLFLYSLGDNFITDASGLAAYHTLTATLVAMFMVVMCFYIVWFISGREL